MFTEAKETKTHKYVLPAVFIALAVIISLAAAGKANAADSDIESIKFEPGKTEVECDPFYTWLEAFWELDDLEDIDNESFISEPEKHLISQTDKLIITREDGSEQTLTPRFITTDLPDPGSSGIVKTELAWFDKDNNRVEDVDTVFSSKNKPVLKMDDHLFVKGYKADTYNLTGTIKIADKSTEFNKKLIIDSSISSFDKKIPVISNKVIKTWIKKSHKQGKKTVIDDFLIKWPKIKGADSYTVKLKQIYPESLKSSEYKTTNSAFRADKNSANAQYLYFAEDDIKLFTDAFYRTADTMMEISVSVIKKSNPKKTGAHYVYGKYSKPVRIFLSKNKTLKAKGKKKSVKLTWSKVDKASGYMIKYSTKKNMAKAKTIKVKGGNKKAYTVKKLKKKKKYYFQVTPYKVFKGKTYTGYASVKKAAKAK